MAIPTLVQSATVATSAASPTSITPTLGGASTQGTLLLMAIAVTGTTPSITTPAGWTRVTGGGPTGLAAALFYQLNNAGGITAVAVTIGGTGGGAVGAIFEYSNLGNYSFDQTATANNVGSNSFSTPTFPTTANIGELIFEMVAYAAATLTPTASNEWLPPVGAIVSTNGTPNAQLTCFWGLSPDGHIPTLTGALSASVAHMQLIATFIIAGTQQPTYNQVGGMSGQLVGQFFQGMIGG